jgi:hypothetical protein
VNEQLVFDLLYYFNAGLESGTHTYVMDNDEGGGRSAIDYVDVVSVVGGSP